MTELDAADSELRLTHENGGELVIRMPIPLDVAGDTLVALAGVGWEIPAATGAKTMTVTVDLDAARRTTTPASP